MGSLVVITRVEKIKGTARSAAWYPLYLSQLGSPCYKTLLVVLGSLVVSTRVEKSEVFLVICSTYG